MSVSASAPFSNRLQQVKEGNLPVTLVIEDLSGNSAIIADRAKICRIEAIADDSEGAVLKKNSRKLLSKQRDPWLFCDYPYRPCIRHERSDSRKTCFWGNNGIAHTHVEGPVHLPVAQSIPPRRSSGISPAVLSGDRCRSHGG